MPILPRVAELGDGALLALRDEDRVVAEAFGAARLRRDPALEDAGAAELLATGRDRHELRHVAGATVAHALQLAEQLRNRGRPLGGVARRTDAGAAAEGVDL